MQMHFLTTTSTDLHLFILIFNIFRALFIHSPVSNPACFIKFGLAPIPWRRVINGNYAVAYTGTGTAAAFLISGKFELRLLGESDRDAEPYFDVQYILQISSCKHLDFCLCSPHQRLLS